MLLLDLPTAAKTLGGIGESTLRRWIKEGRIPAVRLGRRVLIRREALDELIALAERPVQGPASAEEAAR